MQDNSLFGNRSLVTAIMLVATAGYFLLRTDIVLGDPDIWWHIRSGRDMLASRSFPVTDAYSYTFAGQPWIAKEWLSQVLLAAAYGMFGWSGVTLVTVAAAGLAMALVFRAVARQLNPAYAAGLTIAIAAVLTQIVIARPHVFTLPLAVLFATACFDAADRKAPPPWWLLLAVVLWANLHGSFTLAFMIAGLAFLHLLITHGLDDRTTPGKWIIFGLLLPAAALVNPYGWTPFRINLDMMAGNESMPLITEWQAFNAQREVIVLYGLMAAMALLIGLRTRLGWGKVIFVLFTLYMFMTHIRFVYVFFLLVPVVIARNVAETYPTAAGGSQPGRRPVALAVVAAGLAAFVAFAAVKPFAPPARRSIDAAMAFIRDHKLAAGPVLNGYNLGGVLIFNGIKTYIDGRAEQLFRGPFITDFIDSTGPGGEKILRRMLADSGASWAIFPVIDVRIAMMADMPDWQKAYGDDYVAIFTRVPPQ